KHALRSVARQWVAADAEIGNVEPRLRHLLSQVAPTLYSLRGVGLEDQRSEGYMARRAAEGVPEREVVRCLKGAAAVSGHVVVDVPWVVAVDDARVTVTVRVA